MEINEVTEIIEKIYPSQINLKSFNFKKELNPKIWKNGKLKDNIRKRLVKIAQEFIETTELEIIPIDVVIVGSIASFNWSKYSDIDLHIIVDFKQLNDNTDLVKNYLYAKKCEWNDKHGNIKIYGYDVELYAQDISEQNESNGIYSVKYSHWLKIPAYKHKKLDKNAIREIAAMYINKIEYYNKKFDELNGDKSILLLQSKVDYLYDQIIQGRKKSLPIDGEQATGNIVFKVLRRSGHLEMINKLKTKLFDRINSIEETFKVDDNALIIKTPDINEGIDFKKYLKKFCLTAALATSIFTNTNATEITSSNSNIIQNTQELVQIGEQNTNYDNVIEVSAISQKFMFARNKANIQAINKCVQLNRENKNANAKIIDYKQYYNNQNKCYKIVYIIGYNN